LPKERFDKDIELAKVQAKVTEYQTGYFSLFVGMATIGVAFFIAALGFFIQTSLIFFLPLGILALVIAFLTCYWIERTDWEPHMAEIRKDFGKIYRKERVEY
jgi:fatty acid desaturase